MPDVVLVHGLWYRAWSLASLKKRLRSSGHTVHCFSYPTLRQSPEHNARSLAEFCRRHCTGEVRFVGHSLGGLVIMAMLEMEHGLQTGRIVLLGTPINGSVVARRLGSTGIGRKLLGRSGPALGASHAPDLSGRECGMIAGTRSRGLGKLTGALAGANDGTVRLAETQSDLFTDHIELAVTHTGMLFSEDVARQVTSFLERGAFSHRN